MKLKNIIYTTTLTAVMMAAVTGCSKKKLDINANPDDVTDVSVTPSVLLPGALQATTTNIAAEYWFLEWWLGHGARSGSYQSFNEEETYRFTNDFHAGIWNGLYANANNYQIMINKAEALGQGTYEAIGRIMKSHNFQILTDIYGNIPYSDAFKGTAVATPKYDKAVDIYNGIFADLDAASVLLKSTTATDPAKNPDIETADLVFGGNTVLWRKFANTLRLRMLVHLHNGVSATTVAPGIDVAAQVQKIVTDSAGFLGVGESVQINPGFTGTKPQPYFRVWNTNESGTSSQRDWARASEYAIGYYEWTADPRINRFYVAPAGGHNGIPFGTPSGGSAPAGDALSTVRGPGYSPGGANSRAWIMTSAESFFLQAEARQRGVLAGGPTAASLLASGMSESFSWLGLTAAQLSAYNSFNAGYPDCDITAAPLGAGLPGGGLYTILSQKWFALNMIAPYELWTDYRRTAIEYGTGGGYDPGPTISVDPGVTAGAKIPVRLFYPQNEYNYNAANVAAEGTINVTTSRIFWDLN
ncbi:MAG: SusD/RagB family nutrient-binding outer membrane lipoprotein [Chitinophagaceae bacterium]|nr:SusD/RagB family nutrient-binding outer membrane lipoprotein [Chitinophagaceae bacterium]